MFEIGYWLFDRRSHHLPGLVFDADKQFPAGVVAEGNNGFRQLLGSRQCFFVFPPPAFGIFDQIFWKTVHTASGFRFTYSPLK